MQFINRSTVLYGGSAFLGVLTVLYFGFEYLQNLSPFTISVILFSLFGALLATGLNQKGNSESLAYVLSLGSYLTALFYTINRFSFSSNQTLFSLVLSTGIFAGLGYLITEKEYKLERKQLRNILVILAVGVGLLFTYDILSGDVEYTADFNEELTIQEGLELGTLTAEKSAWIPRGTDLPRYQICFYGEDEEMDMRTGTYFNNELLGFGSVEKEYDIETSVRLEHIESFEQGETYSIEFLEDCPDESEDRVVVAGSNGPVDMIGFTG